MASSLSAFVDGEADAAQTVELRRHLRHCMACRAAVRGLHEASQPLTVVLPAAGLVVANGGAEHTSSFFVRVYETVSMHLHERAANSFLRAQAIVDTVTAGKMAAAAASAAAVAGGGVAVEGVLTSVPDRPAALMGRTDGNASLRVVKQPAASRGKTPSRSGSARSGSKPRAHARMHAGTHQRAPTRSRPRQSQPPPSATTSTTSAPRATVASTGGTARSASAASGEFGFEGP